MTVVSRCKHYQSSLWVIFTQCVEENDTGKLRESSDVLLCIDSMGLDGVAAQQGWMSSVGVREKSADPLVSVAVGAIWQAGLESHFSRCESSSALGTQLPWLNWPLPWTWPWALADFALNLTVRQRKERFTLRVLKSLCTEVWSHIIFNWITPSSEEERGGLLLPSGQHITTEDTLQLTECCAPAHSPQARDILCGGRGTFRHISATQECRVWTCLRNWQLERHLLCSSRLHCVKLIARCLWEVWQMPCPGPRLQRALSPSGRRRIAVDNEWGQHQAVWRISRLQDSQLVCPCETCTWCHTLGVPYREAD